MILTCHPAISAFQLAADEVPAYARILAEAGVDPAGIDNLDDFISRVPVIDKARTFGNFPVAELCRRGNPGRLAGVLTSSGHSGQFAFGLYDADSAASESRRIDDALDMLFDIRSRPTLLVNCLPMGVKVLTRQCTVAETSVRPDMVTALIAEFAHLYEQVILVGEASFIKLVLELGHSRRIDWKKLLVHVIAGEEPLAENARQYLEDMLGIDADRPETGMIGSSMGVAELGLNLFFEFPQLVALRRRLHKDQACRHAILGEGATTAPMLFTYDPSRIHVEVLDDNELVISTLDPTRPLPLIRYSTGDKATFLAPELLAAMLGELPSQPVLMVHGRGQCALAGEDEKPVYPEQVKEGLYHDHALAGLVTGNFRLSSGPQRAQVRIQLSPAVAPPPEVSERFAEAISRYVTAPISVTCEKYEDFAGGMALDYERKFDYLGSD